MLLSHRLRLVFVTLAAFGLALPLAAAVYVVDRFDDAPGANVCSGAANDCSLRGAVRKANTDATYSIIQIPAGQYLLTVPGAAEDSAQTGDLDLLAPVTIDAVGVGGAVVTQTVGDRLLHLLPSAGNVSIFGPLRLVGGQAVPAPADSGWGGSIYAFRHGSLILDDVELEAGSAAYGGGCFAYAAPSTPADLTLTDVRMAGCSAVRQGGGSNIETSDVDVWLERVVVEACSAGQTGGGIYFSNISGTTVAVLWDSIVRDNVVDAPQPGFGASAGGIFVGGSHVRLLHSTVAGNLAGGPAILSSGGGGIDVSNSATTGRLDVYDSTVSGNRVEGTNFPLGAAIRLGSGELDLEQATLVAHPPPPSNPGTLYLAPAALATARASIVEGRCFVGTQMTSEGYNVERPASGAVTTCGFDDPSDLVTTATVLRPLSAYGGPTPTHALAPGSPAQLLVPSTACSAEDQRHAPRSLLFCDAGAYESNGTPPGPWLFADGFESGDALAWSATQP